jgi:hypothetical protein
LLRGYTITTAYPRPVVRPDEQEEFPKVTVAFLRRVEELCPRRVAFEHHNRRGNRTAPAQWRVANQLMDHARVAHIELGPPSPVAFTPLPDLVPEERRVYDTAARWYLQLFGRRAVRTVDVDDLDEWETPVPELGVRLVGPAGLPVEDGDGRAELRLLRIGGAEPDSTDPLGSVDIRFALLRRAGWLAGRSVRLVHADLLFGALVEHEIAVDAALDQLRPWLHERVGAVRARVDNPVPRPGLECGRCRFVAGCAAHG